MLRNTLALHFNSVRRVVLTSLSILGVTLLVIASSARASADNNQCQAYGGGQGWCWTAVDNRDVNGDNVRDYFVEFFHYAFGYVNARIDSNNRVYHRKLQQAVFMGGGQYNGLPVVIRAVVDKEGGALGRGQTTLYIYSDLNRNGILNAGEALLRTIRLPATYTYLYFDPYRS